MRPDHRTFTLRCGALSAFLLAAWPLAAAQPEEALLPLLVPGASPVEYLPLATRNVPGTVVSHPVQNAEEARNVMAGCRACVWVAERGEVRSWEPAAPAGAAYSPTLEAFVLEISAELVRLEAEGKDAALSYVTAFRLPPEEAAAIAATLSQGSVRQGSDSAPAPAAAVVFKDGFEDESFTKASWTWIVGTSDASPAVTKCSAFEGSQSLDMFRGGSMASLACTALIPGTGGFGAYVKNSQLVRGATSGSVKVRMSMDASGQYPPAGGLISSVDGGNNWAYSTYRTTAPGWTPYELNIKAWPLPNNQSQDLTAFPSALVGVIAQIAEDQSWGVRFDNFEVTTDYAGVKQLTVAHDGLGSGRVTSSPSGIDCGNRCSAFFSDGQRVTLTAHADYDSSFAGWKGACSGTSSTCTVTMSEARSATAVFDIAARVLTVSKTGAGAGTVKSSPSGIDCGTACSASFLHGMGVVLTATADASSKFVGWSGACNGTGTCQFPLTQARNVTANFAPGTLTLTVEKKGTGGGTVKSAPAGIDCGAACSASFNSGAAVVLTATADASSVFLGWGGRAAGSGRAAST